MTDSSFFGKSDTLISVFKQPNDTFDIAPRIAGQSVPTAMDS